MEKSSGGSESRSPIQKVIPLCGPILQAETETESNGGNNINHRILALQNELPFGKICTFILNKIINMILS